MSTINPQDQELLTLLKKKIQQVSGLPSPDNWSQKDFDFLVFFIEEKSGIRISLSTLKRIWKNENNRLPHISTLDALSQVAFQKKWLSLKSDSVLKQEPISSKKEKSSNKILWSSFIVIVMGLLIFFSYGYFKNESKNKTLDIGNVQFSAHTSVDNRVPNSVVFDYDVSEIEAEKFYLQQSWDASRRVEILKENKQQTDIYYLPGLYFAKLIADTTILAQIPVHIKTDDWHLTSNRDNTGKFYDRKQWLTNGTLGVLRNEKTLEESNLLFYNSRDFKTDGDNFQYTSSFKMDSIPTYQCPKMSLILKGNNDYFIFQILKKGCESDAFLKLSEKQISGKTNDLTMFGADVYTWQNIHVNVENKVLTLSLNGNKIYENEYGNPIGSLKEITYVFSGWGAIDNVELKDTKGIITYADDFE
ncbi:hypothetical protein GGR42_002076 [Saonia flava]|uniref:Uncharacterized protein n=1 Tax=Saonia flava TaxID=523696 RepID=A0A846R2M2_9FLAO|nr:hypothetical protein [Saonia flava]NJB71614.1 hypothetical protein [Saonia flava]